MTETILSNLTASITELKVNPMATIREAEGETIAILNRNKPAFYCVAPEVYEHMMELIEDAELARIVREREGEERIEVSWDDL